MCKATINYDDGWIRFWPDYHLPDDEYQEVTQKYSLRWKRAEQCFAGPWSPGKEDFLFEKYGVELETDTTDLLLVAEQRASYYQNWAQNASKRAKQAWDTVDSIALYIPMGQPILVGHHSEKRHRRDLERIHHNTRKSIDEQKRSEKWDDRATSTLAHAARRYKPGPLWRRIDSIQADVRSWQRHLDKVATVLADDDPADAARRHDLVWSLEEISDEEVVTLVHRSKVRAERWLVFLHGRLQVAMALYAETEGIAAEQEGFEIEVGGGLATSSSGPGGWYQIEKINKKTVKVSGWLAIKDMTYNLTMDSIKRTMSKEEWEQTPKQLYGGGYRLLTPPAKAS